MRFKNFTLLFLMGIFGLFTTNLFAQQDATIDPSEIRYWVGEGENEVVVAISWCSYTETALAWGYRFDGNATVYQALTDISAADERLTVFGAAPTNITYVDDEYNLTMCTNPDAEWGDPDYDIPIHSVNGLLGQNIMSAEPIHHNDFVKIGGYACGIMSSDWSTISWTTEIIPAIDPNAGEEIIDATIPADQIVYWVGEGENEVVVAISWCSYTETALAWGYRFDGDATVYQALTDIAAADSRLTVIGAAPTNITYVDDEYYLTMCTNPDAEWGDPDYDIPMHSVNGLLGQNMMSAEPIHHNDFVKIGGYACGIMSPDWSTISWTTEIIPATEPSTGVVDATITADQIKYWIGEGENEVVVAISWCSYTETALAWGYRFDGEATVFQALTDIAAADDRLTVIGAAPTNITYVDEEYNLTMCTNPDAEWGDPDYDVPMHSVNGLMGMNMMSAEPIHNGDFVKIGGVACGIMSADWTTISWEQPIEPATFYTSLNENQSMTLSVYPNPAGNEAFVTLEDAGLNMIAVYDIQGRMVSHMNVEAKAGEQVRLSAEMLNSGVYFVRVSNDKGVRTAKLVVK